MSSLKNQVVKTNTGIKAEGELEEVAEVSEEMKDSLENVCKHEESVENFDYWKPEEDDEKENIKDRTVSLESISEKKVEKESEGLKKGLSEARNELRIRNDNNDGPDEDRDEGKKSKILNAWKEFFKPIVSSSLKFIRQTEELIYSNIMLRFNPYYFNAKKFSVSLKETDGKFEMVFNSPEKEYRQELRSSFDVEE